MIVKCERCQTRFKIPDEKVTEKGVKVRCTRCQNTFRVAREPASPPPAEMDPFALFDMPEKPTAPKPEGEITRPSFFKEGVEATRPPPPQPPSQPWNDVDSDLGEDVHHEPTRVGPLPLPPGARPPAVAPLPFEPPPAIPAARPNSVAAAPAPEADPFFDIDLDDGPPPQAPKPATEAGDVDLFGSFDFGEPEPPPASAEPASAESSSSDSALSAPEPSESAPFNLPGGAEPDRSLFGHHDDGMTDEAVEFKVSEPDSPVGRKEVIDLPPMSAVELDAPASVREVGSEPPSPMSRPTGRPEDMGLPERKMSGAARKVTGVVINLVVAAVLVVGLAAVGSVYLREGRLDWSVLSPSRLQALVTPPPRPLVAVDVSNGLYDTREGSPLFFVRGDVENRGTSAARVKVRAALYDGDQRVKSQEGLAGALPTPEELYAIANVEGAAALRARLDASATEVPPGGRAPFALVFQEYPAELDAFRLEVTLEPVALDESVVGTPEGAQP